MGLRMIGIKRETLAIVMAFLFVTILSWRFSASYFSYALIVWGVFFIADGVYSWKSGYPFIPKITKPFLYMAFGILGLYFLFIFSALFHGDSRDISKAFDHFSLTLPFFMTWWISSKYDVKRGIHWGLLIGLAIACIIGGYQWLQHPGTRIMSSYAHPNHFGTMINLMTPCIVYSAYKEKSALYRVLSALVVAAALICLLMTDSRGALMGLMGAVILGFGLSLWLLKDQASSKVKKIGAAFMVAVILTGGAGAWCMQYDRGEVRFGGEREFMIEASLQMWEDHKFTGVGADHWKENYYGKYHPKEGRETFLDMPHNMPLYFLSTGGILGAAGYVLYLISTFLGLAMVIREKRDFLFAAAVSIIFFSFIIQGMVDTTIINKIPARMYFALMGIVAACLFLGRNSREEIEK